MGTSMVLYEAAAYVVLPPLAVRQARVEDHDELLPVLERASARCAGASAWARVRVQGAANPRPSDFLLKSPNVSDPCARAQVPGPGAAAPGEPARGGVCAGARGGKPGVGRAPAALGPPRPRSIPVMHLQCVHNGGKALH